MRSLLLGLMALVVMASGLGLSQSKAEAAATGTIHGRVVMNAASCPEQMHRDFDCDPMNVKTKFSVIISKYTGPDHTKLQFVTKIRTDMKGQYSVDLPEGEYRFVTMAWYTPDDSQKLWGDSKDITVTSGQSHQRNLFHYYPMP